MKTFHAVTQRTLAGVAALLILGGVLRAQTPAASQPTQVAGNVPADARFRKEYLVLPGDQLDIVVRGVAQATRNVVVRPDGQISLPFVKEDIPVAGLTTSEVDTKLEGLLAARLVSPEVTVIANKVHDPSVYVGGEVSTPTAIPIRNAEFAIQAISIAGGLRRTASPNNIVIIRLDQNGVLQTLPLQITGSGQRAPYEALARTRLLPDDIIFVPESGRSQVGRFIDDYINHPLQGVNSILGTIVNFRLIRVIANSQ